LLADPRFADNEARLEHRAELTEILDSEFIRKTGEEWRALLAGQVPCAPVYDIGQALDNPFVRQQGKIVTVPHPQRGQVKLIGPPFHCPGEEFHLTLAERLGESTEAILRELGYDDGRIAALREAGAI
jgi:crotonobetainyl-CoA:carnitine CoA-transferase CaiB-like acyl-CoA transferase